MGSHATGPGSGRLARRRLLAWVPSRLAIHAVHLVALRLHLLRLAGRRGARILMHLLPHLRALGHHPLHVLRGRSAWLLAKAARTESKCQGECGRTYHGRQVVRVSHHLAFLISSSIFNWHTPVPEVLRPALCFSPASA